MNLGIKNPFELYYQYVNSKILWFIWD